MIKRIFKKKFQTGDASLDIREESHSLGYDQNCFKCIKTIISLILLYKNKNIKGLHVFVKDSTLPADILTDINDYC